VSLEQFADGGLAATAFEPLPMPLIILVDALFVAHFAPKSGANIETRNSQKKCSKPTGILKLNAYSHIRCSWLSV